MTISDNPLLAQMRSQSEMTWLTDRIAVTRLGPKTLVNGREVQAEVPVYTGPGRLVRRVSRSGDRTLQLSIAEFPNGAFQALEGDLLLWIKAEDARLVGLKMVATSQEPGASTTNFYQVNVEMRI